MLHAIVGFDFLLYLTIVSCLDMFILAVLGFRYYATVKIWKFVMEFILMVWQIEKIHQI